jgi:short-subunit dehydrogenase
MRFRDQVVWITGASSGIGEGLAIGFAAEGAKLILSARREAELARVRNKCTGSPDVLLVPFDMTDETGRARGLDVVLKRFGRIDVMVQNAGVSQRSLAKDTALSVDRKIMELDYFSVVALTKLILPHMIERKAGHFVITSSVAGKFGVPMRSAYCASKHALHGFFDTLAVECSPYNILCSLLVVAGVQTDVSKNALTGDGSLWGKMDDTQSRGLSVEECTRIILEGVAAKKREINVLEGPTGTYLWLKRLLPDVLHNKMVKLTLARFKQGKVGIGK